MERKSPFTYAATWWSSTSESSELYLTVECIPEEERLYPICLIGDIKTELQCSAYHDVRKDLFASSSFLNDTFNEISNVDKMCFILSDNRIANMSAKAWYEILAARAKIRHPNNVNVNN